MDQIDNAKSFVLILVLVEVDLRAALISTSYFGGTPVLILVLVEVDLREVDFDF